MYALSNSILEQMGEYRVEMYTMSILKYNATVEIQLKIFELNGYESYMAEYVIINSDGKTSNGSCLNYDTKEATIMAVEKFAIKALKDLDHIWQ